MTAKSPKLVELVGQASPLELSRDLQARLYEARKDSGYVDRSHAQEGEGLSEAIRFNVEAMHVELSELLNLVQWKGWKTYPAEFWTEERDSELVYEAIDLQFFLNNIFIALGIDDDQLRACFHHKYEENLRRQRDEYK